MNPLMENVNSDSVRYLWSLWSDSVCLLVVGIFSIFCWGIFRHSFSKAPRSVIGRLPNCARGCTVNDGHSVDNAFCLQLLVFSGGFEKKKVFFTDYFYCSSFLIELVLIQKSSESCPNASGTGGRWSHLWLNRLKTAFDANRKKQQKKGHHVCLASALT